MPGEANDRSRGSVANTGVNHDLKYLEFDTDLSDDIKTEIDEPLISFISNHSVLEELHMNVLDFVQFKQDAFAASKTLTRLQLKKDESSFPDPMNFPIVPYLEKLGITVNCSEEDVDESPIFLGPWLSLHRRLQELKIFVHDTANHCISGKIVVSLTDMKHIKSLNVISLIGCRLVDDLQRPQANDTEMSFPSLRNIIIVSCSGEIKFAHLEFPNHRRCNHPAKKLLATRRGDSREQNGVDYHRLPRPLPEA